MNITNQAEVAQMFVQLANESKAVLEATKSAMQHPLWGGEEGVAVERLEAAYWQRFNQAVDYLAERPELEIPQSADARMTQEIKHRRGQ